MMGNNDKGEIQYGLEWGKKDTSVVFKIKVHSRVTWGSFYTVTCSLSESGV